LVSGFDRLLANRATGNIVTGQNPFGGYLSGADSVQRPNLVHGVPVWISDPNAAGERQSTKLHSMSRSGQSKEISGAKKRIRRN